MRSLLDSALPHAAIAALGTPVEGATKAAEPAPWHTSIGLAGLFGQVNPGDRDMHGLRIAQIGIQASVDLWLPA